MPRVVDRRPPHRGGWTYADYAALPDDGRRYEILDGRLIMAPAPNAAHQMIAQAVYRLLYAEIEAGGQGQVFIAPFDVELTPAHGARKATVVQPDVLVLLKNSTRHRLLPSHVVGVPDLVVEVTSPGTAGYDRRDKLDAYAKAQAPEVWLVDPLAKAIEVFHGTEGRLISQAVCSGTMALPTRLRRGWKPQAQAVVGSA